ncbi:MAG: PCRF domain-containing protein [Desulfococcaceae bacterium]|jgi:hypothetical protein|nr:PCRF domain-containing protein [Desulfococcaceae bacterium]
MRRKNDGTQIMIRGTLIAAALIFIILAGIWFFRKSAPQSPDPALPESPAENVPPLQTASSLPPPEQNIIRFGSDDEDFQELMERRKAEYGLDRGVDMIVREDETLHIGENKVPMKEILDKIRLEKGNITEEELNSPVLLRSRKERLEHLYEKLRDSEERFRETERKLMQPPGEEKKEILHENMQEYEELGRIAGDFQNYQEVLRDIDTLRKILASEDMRGEIRNETEKLRQKQIAVERDLARRLKIPLSAEIREEERQLLWAELDKYEKRFQEHQKTLNAEAGTLPDEKLQELLREKARLREVSTRIALYRNLAKLIAELDGLLEEDEGTIREKLQDELALLRIRRDDLEGGLMETLLPEEAPDVYGIYVVRKGDNVWNIHFSFLREYFENKAIRISAAADEPIRPGLSSGVGRILKFSENMVYIYNLREKKLEPDLNIIHPLSKIVVFNMGQAFEMLRQLDYSNIHRIRFDGENLWIPAAE